MANWGGAGKGAISGAATGSMFGPWGTAIGAGVGGLIGLFKKKKPKPEEINSNISTGFLGPSSEAQGNMMQSGLTDFRNNLIPQNQATQNNQTDANATAVKDYGGLMNEYNNYRSSLAPYTPYKADQVSYTRSPEMQNAMTGYQGFADTGGYSTSDQQEIRARGIGPLRSAYSSAQNGLDRQRALQGGYSPNMAAAQAKMAREQGSAIAAQTSNVNAGLAEAIRSGKLAGLSGLGGLATSDTGFNQNAQLANQNANLQAAGMNIGAQEALDSKHLQAINAKAGLYGATPGMANMFGNQAQASNNQLLDAQQLQQQLGLGLIGAQINRDQLPSSYDKNLNSVNNTMTTAGRIAEIAGPWLSKYTGSGGSGFADNSQVFAGSLW